jgi:hypothetical protein
MLRRWFDVVWNGDETVKIKAFWAQGGVLPLGGEGGYFCPVRYPPRASAQRICPMAAAFTAATVSSVRRRRMGSRLDDGRIADLCGPRFGGRDGRKRERRVVQSFEMRGYMRKGATQKVGDAWLWLQPNDAETALRRMNEWFRRVGMFRPKGVPIGFIAPYSTHSIQAVLSARIARIWGLSRRDSVSAPHRRPRLQRDLADAA